MSIEIPDVSKMKKKGIIQMGVDAIIRPPRHHYKESDLSPTEYAPGYGIIRRHAIQFTNSRGMKLVGSYYPPNEQVAHPSCVIYLHGNASSQLEGQFLVPIFVPAGVSVLCFDMSGSGNSEGEYISLGYFEKDDVAKAIEFVRTTYHVELVALWGRSMGAATCFYALADDPTIAGAVADSPFASLSLLIKDLAQRVSVPGFVVSMGSSFISSKIKKIAHFDPLEVEPVKYAPMCFTPIVIIHGENDDFILPKHSQMIYEKYCGEDKKLYNVPGNHNSERPPDVIIAAVMHLARCLDAPVVIDDVSQVLHVGSNHFEDFDHMLAAMGNNDAYFNPDE